MTKTMMPGQNPSIEKEEKPVELPEKIRELLYVGRQFPKDPTEMHVDYKTVGLHCYRINFWKINEKVKSSMEKDVVICRSYYVVVNIDKDGKFSHRVL